MSEPDVVFVAFDGVQPIDVVGPYEVGADLAQTLAIGPYEVLQRIPAFDITFAGHARGEVRSENGMLGVVVDGMFEDLPSPDVIVFPGGVGTRPLQYDTRVLDWVRNAHASTTFTTSDGAAAHRTARRPDRGASGAAHDRVRPAAAVRLRRTAQGRG